MKKIIWIILLFSVTNFFAQNAITGSGFTSGWPSSCSTNSPFKYLGASINSTYTSGDLTPNGISNQYWRMAIDWGGTVKQLNNTGADQLVTFGTKYTLNSTCTTTGAMYVNVASTNNRYVFKTLNAGSNPTGNWVFFELGGSSVNISSVSQTPTSSSVNDSNSVVVTATLSGNFPTGQGAYLRYSTDNWSTSTVLSMSGSGTSYNATIPAQILGTTVKYYLFTSGSGLTIAPSDADLYTINWNAGSVNGGSNYSYTVISANSISTGTISGTPLCAGSSVSVPYTASGTFSSGNIFTAQLSDAAGSFSSPTTIGTVSSTTSGTISATIPSSTVYGAGYRIRVISSNPAITGTDNGTNFTVNPLQFFANLETQNQTICRLTNITNGNITGRFYVAGITNSVGQGSGVTVEFGYNVANTNPNTWTTWTAATYKEDFGNDDRYTINGFGSALPAGTYYYTFRYKVGSCGWVYGGYSTGNWDGTTNVSGVLTVNSSVLITSPPSNIDTNYCTGDAITLLSVTATGSNLSYQWYSNTTNTNSGGTLISGATNSYYAPSNSAYSKYYYYVIVSNSCASVNSNPSGLITVNPNSFFANLETQNQSICSGNNVANGNITGRLYIAGLTNSAGQGSGVTVEFGYNSANTNPNTWSNWTAATYKEDSGNDDRYTINGFGSTFPAGTYYYTFRYRVGSCSWVYGGYNTGNWDGTTNINGVLTVNTSNAITTQPSVTAQNICINTSATALSVVATGTSLSYQWYSNTSASNSGGTLISGANSASYTPPTNTAGTKYYYVIVSGSCGASVTSNVSGAIVVNANSTAALSSAVGTDNQTVLNDSTPITTVTYALSGISNATVTGLPTGVTGTYSGNTFTISGAPTQVGVFNYSITFTANCGTVNNLTGTIKVNSYTVEFANIQFPKTQQTILLGDTFDIYAQVKITGITDSVGHGAGASGWLGYSTSNTNPNTWTNWTAINYNPGYESSGSYQIANDEYYYPDFVNAENLVGGTYYYASRFQRNGSSEYTYGGTDETAFNFSGGIWGINSSNGPINVSGIVKVVDEVIWDGTQWKWYDDDDATWKIITEPNQRLKAKIEGNYPSSAPSFTCKKLTIDNGISVTIGSGKYIKVINEIVNNNTGSTNFTVESDANLIQVNDSSVDTGKVIVKRNTSLKRLDYNYWGCPVTGQNLRYFSINTLIARFYVYRETDDYFDGVFAYSSYPGFSSALAFPLQDKNSYNFVAAKGYVVRSPNDFTSSLTTFIGSFEGNPNNGQKTFSLEYTDANHGFNLVANPYPSNIDFDALYTENQTKIYQTAYFWTNVNPNPIMQGTNYPANYNGTDYYNNYAVYNGSGGVSATSTSAVNGSKTPNQFIKVGQGFLIKSKAAGKNQNLIFKNSIRTSDNSGFYFNNKNSSTAIDRFWLTLSTPLDVHNDILIAYKENASDDFELDFDAPLVTSPPDSFYSILGDKKLMIQGRKYPLLLNDKVILGQRFYEDGTYTIAIKQKEGIFDGGQSVYLKDKATGTVTNLSETAYTFFAVAGEETNRFEILYKYSTLGNNDATKKGLTVYQTDGYVMVEAPEKINKLSIYDATGRLMYQENTNDKNAKVSSRKLIAGEYFVAIETINKKETKKIIIK